MLVGKTVESPMETIAGTIVDFFQFTSERLNPDDLYSLTFIIVKKIVLRYLLFARDFLVRSKSKSVAINHFISGTTQLATRLTTETIDDFGKIIVGTLKLPGDMMSLIRSETKEAVDSGAANDDDSDAVVDHENSGGEQMDNISKLFTEDQFLLIKKDLKLILDMYAKVNSIISPDVIAQDVEEEEEVEEGEEEEEDEEEREARKAAKVQNRPARQHESIALTNTTATATVMLLSLLSDTLTAMLFGEVASASHLDGIMTSQFHVTVSILLYF